MSQPHPRRHPTVPHNDRRGNGNEENGAGGGRRDLHGNEQNRVNYLVDEDGNEYDPYSLAWRYLGLYVDCTSESSSRELREENGGGTGSSCVRKLLWAAYIDNEYEGNYIEEYSFYDIPSASYDNSTCLASGTDHRCAKLNCHEPYTEGNGWELFGIYKETAGIYDWFEQLFKHEGVCIWNDDDVYDTMHTWMEKFPYQCTKLGATDGYGNTLYYSTMPLAEGNMTIGIYTDTDCLTLSEDKYYSSYDSNFDTAILTWNEAMLNFKTCQPCRGYNLVSGKKYSRRDRFLQSNNNNANNDGHGSALKRYNCYDKAGYTNVDQCYKFMSKTTLAVASQEDLELADEQGTILKIMAYGTVYGAGGYVSEPDYEEAYENAYGMGYNVSETEYEEAYENAYGMGYNVSETEYEEAYENSYGMGDYVSDTEYEEAHENAYGMGGYVSHPDNDTRTMIACVAAFATMIVATALVGMYRRRARRCKTESMNTSLTVSDINENDKPRGGGLFWKKEAVAGNVEGDGGASYTSPSL